ncbi:MAG: type II secretion system protein N [Thermodesulfobacteriota bacterium]
MSDNKRKKKRSATSYAVYGALFFAFFLLLYFPASKAQVLLKKHIPVLSDHLELTGLQGPWYAGKASRGSVAQIPVRHISWSFHPSFSGLIQADVILHGIKEGYLGTRIGIRLDNTLTCSDLRARIPLKLFQDILRRHGWEAAGSMDLAINQLHLQDGYPSKAEGTIDLSKIRIVHPRQLSLGDFKVELISNDQEIQAFLSDRGGPLSADGTLHIRNDGSYFFSGNFTAREEDKEELKSVLRLFGNPDKNGTVSVKFSGRLGSFFS